MKPLRVYIDTSVVGGCLDPEFRDVSLRLFDQFRNGKMIAVISPLTMSEIEPAPKEVHAVLQSIPDAYRENVAATADADRLASLYIAAGVIGGSMRSDAEHIAMATVQRVDVLVSWNFKHIVNERRAQGYNSVNLREGHPILAIRTPAEVLADAR
ncbi:MAG TPA: hypothetical protein VF710_08280 [Longimicrobium sp.]|jgi:hypothetical protein